MEENLHKDNLEEFLKNSFEGYSESPPDDVWNRISEGLPTASPPMKVVSFRRWWLVAAAAVIAGIFLFQHFYFTRQIKTLNSELIKTNTELRQPEKQSVSPQNKVADTIQSQTQTETLPETDPSEFVKAENKTGQKNEQTNTPKAPARVIAPQKTRPPLPPDPLAPENTKNAQTPDSKAVATTGTQENLTQANEESTRTETPNTEKELTKTATPNAGVILSFLDLKDVSVQSNQVQVLPNTGLRAPNTTSVRGHSLSIGAHTLPMVSREKINSLRPGFPPMEKVFDDKKETNGQTFMAGLAIETQVADNFSFGSGLDYRKSSFNSSHQPVFKFKDRRPPHGNPHGGPKDFEHDFQYTLNTSAGAVTVEVRAESTDTSMQIPDDEEIGLKIGTRQSFEYLTLPLYARYTLGKGKLRFSLKGGFLVNFLLNKNFEIAEITSLNPHFQFRKNEQPKGRQPNLKGASFDYLASVGLDYALTNSLNFRLEPTLVGSLTSIHNNRHISSSQLSAGVNVGVMYNF